VPKAIILDRDGTLVDVVRDEETGIITTAFHPDQLRLLGGVITGLKKLSDAGFLLAIATNQPGPAKGHFSQAAVIRTNDALVDLLRAQGITIAKVVSCMHHPDGGAKGDPSLVGPCACRKPKPGMLDDLARDLSLDRASSWMVGDTTSDVQAGQAAKMRTGLLFDTKRCELCPLRNGPSIVADVHASNLDKLADEILLRCATS
jgi:D-glycero-D-manno-heptose 1,7-bisphosphate phosphatase